MSTKDSVLKALRKSGDHFISGEDLSKDLGISRTSVWKAINSLREEGYNINAATNKGYILIETDEMITEDSLRAFLPARYKNNGIFVYDTVVSTNITAKHIALQGFRNGDTVIAMQQTGGRGRLGRSFFSPRTGIYLSIIIKPSFDFSRSVLVTSAAAVSVAEAIEDVCGQKAKIKWVNDVYIGKKKVCGILTEAMTGFETGQIETLIIGIGVNTAVEGFPEDLLDTVGAVEGSYSKAQLAASIICRTLDYTSNLESRSFIGPYREKSMVIGKTVKIYKGRYNISPENEIPGITARVLDIDDNGQLVVLYSNGTRETLSTGEISIRL